MMEHKHKLLASASCQPLGACTDGRFDWLSTLPDELAHHILSFLNFRGLAKVGCLSKRCRELYLSTPSLSFDGISFIELLSCFDRFLIQRGDNKIQQFRIVWNSVCQTTNRSNEQKIQLFAWINYAVRCNVEELDLKFLVESEEFSIYDKGVDTLALPSCIFLCQSLRFLRVALALPKWKAAPSFGFSSNLQCLELVKVAIDERFCKSISCFCKCLRELRLKRVIWEKNISIESSSLESFHLETCNVKSHYYQQHHLNISGEKLEDLDIYWVYTSAGKDLVNIIFAPNLKYLKLRGEIMINLHDFGKLMCLEKVEILLFPRELGFDKVFEVLCRNMPRLKFLTLNNTIAKALFNKGSMPTQPLDEICYFCMTISRFEDDLVPPMVHLLREMPNLKTLHVQTHKHIGFKPPPNVSKFGRRYWKFQNLACIHRLEEVTIEISNAAMHNELELALYLLEHAENLKKMVIFYSPLQSASLIFTLLETKSSMGKVIFQER